MRALLFFVVFFTLVNIHAQKLVRKAFIDPRTETIQIDAQYCYRIDLKTASSNEVEISASMEGEYAKDLLISIEQSGTTAMISADFQPLFINPNDKLSAHKVVSIALEIRVPEYKYVDVFGTNTNLYATGKYEDLNITLSDGRCTLENVSESVEVTTQKGDIMVMAPSGNIVAESTYGNVEKGIIPFGYNQFILKTIEGDIFLTKTK
ncbi:hypothetical protein D2V08_05310 [Flagellimonas lutimaris]|uniref:Adhesin domain-containing protein n=1 Tax=Flagellimonas lutimaris TaxID=475082 RepID=A0A3A1NDD1_9FLAO|nr:hypothetical protein [Allomuricauda lutimaris]RIV34798.1 hypothetical protein D2V08_05310 [Allomuricauda lutimaris]